MSLKVRLNKASKTTPNPHAYRMYGGHFRCLRAQCDSGVYALRDRAALMSCELISRRFRQRYFQLASTELLERGVIVRHVRGDLSALGVEYELTELGQELIPALDEIVKVGHKLSKTMGYPQKQYD